MPSPQHVTRTRPSRATTGLFALSAAFAAGCTAGSTPLPSLPAPNVSAEPVGQVVVETRLPHTQSNAATEAPELSPRPQGTVAAHPEPAMVRVAWLSPRHVSAAVRVQHGAFSACRTIAGRPYEATGDAAITLGWCVEASGAVSEVALDRSSFESPRVNDCMLSVAREVRFPASPTRTEVSWTVHFRDSDKGQLARGPVSLRGLAGGPEAL